jgi:hypothetical protein
MERAWAKYLTGNTYGTIRQVTFNPNGKIVAFLLGQPVLLFVRAIDGGVINSQLYSTITGNVGYDFR